MSDEPQRADEATRDEAAEAPPEPPPPEVPDEEPPKGVWNSLKALIRLEAYDTSTAAGRSRERYRRAALTTVTAFGARGLIAVESLISVPITIGYLGKERYGLWSATNAILAWAALADFGLARGLQNHLSEAYGKGDHTTAAKQVSTAFFALLFIAMGLACLFLPAVYFVPWTRVLNVKDPIVATETIPAVVAIASIFLINFPLSVVGQVYAAYQRAYVSNLFNMAGTATSLVTLLIAVHFKLGLPYLIVAFGGVGMILTAVNLAYVFTDIPWVRPRWSLVSRDVFRKLVKVSTPMLLFQIGAMLITELQLLLIAQASGLASVTDYTVFQRVFSIPIYIVAVIEGPLVPAFREAWARGDKDWLRSAFWKLQKTKIWICGIAAVAFLLVGNPAALFLSDQAVQFSYWVWIAAGVLAMVGCWNGGYTALFMSVERLWILVWTILANGIVTAPLTFYLGRKYGTLGIICATTAFSLFVTAWLMPLLGRDILRRDDDGKAPGDKGPSDEAAEKAPDAAAA